MIQVFKKKNARRFKHDDKIPLELCIRTIQWSPILNAATVHGVRGVLPRNWNSTNAQLAETKRQPKHLNSTILTMAESGIESDKKKQGRQMNKKLNRWNNRLASFEMQLNHV